MRGKAWTAEGIELLRRLWADGETATAIGVRLGGMSRSAVLGKVFRLRLRTEKAATARALKKSAAQIGSGVTVLARRRRSQPRKDAQSPPATGLRHKTLLELTNSTCRWPHGRPGGKFFFCGAPEADLECGIPYCARHMRRAYPGFVSSEDPALQAPSAASSFWTSV
jgi:GcrA cell cycle regulator